MASQCLSPFVGPVTDLKVSLAPHFVEGLVEAEPRQAPCLSCPRSRHPAWSILHRALSGSLGREGNRQVLWKEVGL